MLFGKKSVPQYQLIQKKWSFNIRNYIYIYIYSLIYYSHFVETITNEDYADYPALLANTPSQVEYTQHYL